MRKLLSLLIFVGIFFPVSGTSAFAQEGTFFIGQESPGMYVEIKVENLDKPGQPISVGQRFRIRANCVVDIGSIYSGNFKTDSGRRITSQNDPLEWSAGCLLIIWYGDKKGAILSNEDEIEMFEVNTPALVSFPFFDETVRADKSELLSASGDGQLWGQGFQYTSKNGQTYDDDVDLGRGFKEKPLFTPQAKQKSNSNTTIVELDGEEEADGDPVLVVKKESSVSYLISLLNHIPNQQVKIKATKQSSKSYTFSVKTDSDGDLIFRAKRNLKGYKLELLDNGKVLASKFVPK